MRELENMKLANANFKNYIFNKNRTLISKELFEQMSDSEFVLYDFIIADEDDWGKWQINTVKWLLKDFNLDYSRIIEQ